MALTVAELCASIPGLELRGDGETTIDTVTADSRACGPGVLFVAVRGTDRDGHGFLSAALAAGSTALVCARDAAAAAAVDAAAVDAAAILLADDTRPLPALIARELHGRPDESLLLAGVTGTNGKTTVAFLLQRLLGELHGCCGLLGTIRYQDGRRSEKAPLTTPGGPLLYEWLGRMRDNGCVAAAMEISSHALDQGRTAGLRLDVAVLTNLGRDHLDYHRTLEEYLAAKARILDLLRRDDDPGAVALNADDEALSGLDLGDLRVVRFSPDGAGAADLTVVDRELTLAGTRLVLTYQGRRLALESPLVGRFNAENLTAALAAGLALGFDGERCCRALAGVPQVPGRLERIPLPSGAIAVVDYAHTHDALEAVLETCRELTDGRLLVVFGAGGDRDRGKRALMGAVAARRADETWITSDNPRSEEPLAICAEIEAGLIAEPQAATGYRVIADRRDAIGNALAAARAGDIVVIAGKGHEDYQLVGDRVLDLDDRVVVHEWIAKNGNEEQGR